MDLSKNYGSNHLGGKKTAFYGRSGRGPCDVFSASRALPQVLSFATMAACDICAASFRHPSSHCVDRADWHFG